MKSGFAKVICLLLAAVLIHVLAGSSLCSQEGSAPVMIEADRMESVQKDNAVLFSGNVEAKQGDLIIHADEMKVHYKEQKKESNDKTNESQKITKIFATGNVKLSKEGWVASGDNLEYFDTERKVILTGNTKVWQQNNLVTGESIVLFLDEGKSVIERSSKEGERVKAFFYPDSETKKDKGNGSNGSNHSK